MAKFSFSYVKKNPVMFGAIIIVFGLLFWMMMNKGAGASSGSTQVVNTGPSEQLQAVAIQTGAQLQAKQLDANSAVAMGAIQLEALTRQLDGQQGIALLEATYRTAELASNERLTELQTTASLVALQSQLNSQASIVDSNNQFMVDYATVAADSAVTQLAIGAALQRDLGAQSLAGYKYGIDASIKQAAIGSIGQLKKSNRDDALAGIIGYVPRDTGGGCGFLGSACW